MESSPGEYQKSQETAIWERLEISAPPNYETVYHVTGSEHLEAINREGLVTQPEKRNPAVERLLDEAMPSSLKEAGASRECVFASPRPDADTFLSQSYYLEKANTVLELAVDRDNSYVADSNLIGEIGSALFAKDGARAEEIARDYWQGCISLRDFLDEYVHDGDEYRPITNANLPWLSRPEVLVPNGVPQKYIRVYSQRVPDTGTAIY